MLNPAAKPRYRLGSVVNAQLAREGATNQGACMAPCFVSAAAAASVLPYCLGHAAAFVTTRGESTTTSFRTGLLLPQHTCYMSPSTTSHRMGLQRQHHNEHQQQRRRQKASVPGYRSKVGSNRCRIAQTHRHAHKTEEGVPSGRTSAGGRSVADGEGELSLLDELLERCAEATKSDAAAESSHTGSSEWAGFKTAPALLEVRTACALYSLRATYCVLDRAHQCHVSANTSSIKTVVVAAWMPAAACSGRVDRVWGERQGCDARHLFD